MGAFIVPIPKLPVSLNSATVAPLPILYDNGIVPCPCIIVPPFVKHQTLSFPSAEETDHESFFNLKLLTETIPVEPIVKLLAGA